MSRTVLHMNISAEEKKMSNKFEICCSVCGKGGKTLKRCTGCRGVLYCSRSCQIQDWATHKKVCVKKEEKKLTENSNPAATQTNQLDVSEEGKTLNQGICSSTEDTSAFQIQHFSEINNSVKSLLNQKATSVNVTVKCMKERHKLTIDSKAEGQEILNQIASSVHIPVDKLKLVCKGKIVTADSISLFMKDKAVFQAIGEVAESEEGLESGHVDCIVARLGVDRNEAVRALRETGDVVDAILYLGNK